MDPYYNRPEVSNSDLSALLAYFQSKQQVGDIQAAYRFGTLVDAIITEPAKVNYFKRTIEDYTYSDEEMKHAIAMKNAYMRDEQCKLLNSMSTFQKVTTGRVQLEYNGFPFSLMMRCKWDLWMKNLNHGADIKSTAAETQKQFEEAVRYFDYDRQRAVYMTLAGSHKDLLIGISKKNYKIFKVPITRESELFKTGMQKFEEIAFKYWCLFGDLKYDYEKGNEKNATLVGSAGVMA